MALKIIGQSDADDVARQLRERIEAAVEGAEVQVLPQSAGHFVVRVVSSVFEDKSLVQRQQLVYAAIAPLMSGDAPPVHAIDRLEIRGRDSAGIAFQVAFADPAERAALLEPFAEDVERRAALEKH